MRSLCRSQLTLLSNRSICSKTASKVKISNAATHALLISKNKHPVQINIFFGKGFLFFLYSLPASLAHCEGIASPLRGRVIPLSEVNDAIFSSELTEKGVAVVPLQGKLYSRLMALLNPPLELIIPSASRATKVQSRNCYLPVFESLS